MRCTVIALGFVQGFLIATAILLSAVFLRYVPAGKPGPTLPVLMRNAGCLLFALPLLWAWWAGKVEHRWPSRHVVLVGVSFTAATLVLAVVTFLHAFPWDYFTAF